MLVNKMVVNINMFRTGRDSRRVLQGASSLIITKDRNWPWYRELAQIQRASLNACNIA